MHKSSLKLRPDSRAYFGGRVLEAGHGSLAQRGNSGQCSPDNQRKHYSVFNGGWAIFIDEKFEESFHTALRTEGPLRSLLPELAALVLKRTTWASRASSAGRN